MLFQTGRTHANVTDDCVRPDVRLEQAALCSQYKDDATDITWDFLFPPGQQFFLIKYLCNMYTVSSFNCVRVCTVDSSQSLHVLQAYNNQLPQFIKDFVSVLSGHGDAVFDAHINSNLMPMYKGFKTGTDKYHGILIYSFIPNTST